MTAYFTIGFFTFSSAQILDENIADSLISVLLTEELADTTQYIVAMEVADHATTPHLSLQYAQDALEIANKLQNSLWQGSAWLNIGQSHEALGDHELSLQAVLKSISYYQEAKSPVGTASAYLVLGNIYNRQNNFSQAFQYYNQSIDIFREEKDTVRLATALLNVSEVYQENTQYDSAMLLLQEARNWFEMMDFEVGMAYAIGNSGIVNTYQRQYEVGEEKLKQAIEILQQAGERYAIAQYQLSIAEIYQERGKITEAIEYAQQSWSVAKQDGLLEQMRNASERLSLLYAEQGNYQEAYRQQSLYRTLKDSINNEAVIRNMADMRTEFEVGQKQTEIDFLKNTRRQQRIIQIGLIFMSLLILAVAWLYYRNYQSQKKANQQLSQQKEELHAQNELLDALLATRERFVSIISHDLRSPVSAFHGLSTLLKMHLEDKSYEALPEVADHIQQSSIQLSMLLDNLLNWSLNRQENIPIQPEKLSVETIANEVVGVFQTVAVVKHIQLQNLIHAPLYVWADRNAVFTILRNLVNNALKFTHQGGKVHIEGRAENHQVIIQVIDTGVGMSQEKIETLFQGSEGQKTWGTSGEKGLGLGLKLVQEFVHRNDGAIQVHSVPKQGTTFSIQLPVYQDQLVIKG
ncbi:MAG: tetratricopeptide repeat-containing sensor histidine kinase [Cyclobacteriaceae bacterium]